MKIEAPTPINNIFQYEVTIQTKLLKVINCKTQTAQQDKQRLNY